MKLNYFNFLPSLSILLLLLMHVKTISGDETRSTYIIHMDKSHMPETSTTHHHWYSSIVDSLKDLTTSNTHNSLPSLLYTYDTVSHGFSATLTPKELQTLEAIPGFVSAYRDHPIVKHTTRSPEFLSLTPSTGIWPAANFGEDIIIGVVDTGVWPESKSFDDLGMSPNIPAKWKGICEEGQEFNSSMCNRKLIGARFFSKGLIAQLNPNNTTISMNSPRDTDGHGTHTASTAAGGTVKDASFFGYAKGTATGIAPRARVATYKVLFDEGGATSDVIAAIDRAVEDGVDILSLSLSVTTILPLHYDPIAKASFAAMERGVVVLASAGNNGSNSWTVGNGAPWVMTVGAGSMDRDFGGTLKLGNGVTITGWSLYPANAIIEDFPLVYNKTLSACNSSSLLREVRFAGIIVCDNTGSIVTQVTAITESQVFGAIFISNNPQYYELGIMQIPGVLIHPKDAPTLIRYAQTRTNDHIPSVTISFLETFLGTKPAPTASSYSSRGPSLMYPDILKPDIMAPGTRVLAAWVPNKAAAQIGTNVALSSDYRLSSGTSMSCPHIAGIAALLKSIHPEWSPAAIRSAMMTTADPLDNTGNPIIDEGDPDLGFASPLVIGSGHVVPNKALDPGLVYDAGPQDYVSILCALNFTKAEIMAITRTRNYDCSKPTLDLNYPSFIVFYDNSSVSWDLKFERVVTNVGEGPATYNVAVRAPRGSEVRVSPPTLVFGKRYEKRSYNVTIKYYADKRGRVTFGELVWVEENGNHRVRSPIVVSS